MKTEFDESIYIEYRGKVFNYIISRINNSHGAEDLFTAVFLKVMSSFDSYDSSKASVSTWIYTITQNTLRDYLRKHKAQNTHVGYSENLETLPFIDERVNGDTIVREEELEQLAGALEQLSERERDIIILRYYKGFHPKQIAETMNISYANVRFINHRAITKLREILLPAAD